MKKQFQSLLVIAVFGFFALASTVNKMHYGAFNYNNLVEDKKERKNYVELNDGTKVYGDQITWKSGILLKDQVRIDDQKFKLSDVRGYRQGLAYYGRLNSVFIKRIVHGKINVYVNFIQVTETQTQNGFTHSYTHTRTDQYAQVGDDGPMQAIGGQEDIKKLVADCPTAYAMADLSNKQIRKAIKADPNYLNSIFDTYNNGCKGSKRNDVAGKN